MTFHLIVCDTSKTLLKLAAPSHDDLLQTLTRSEDKSREVQDLSNIFQLILLLRMVQIKMLLDVLFENLLYNQQDLHGKMQDMLFSDAKRPRPCTTN